MKIEKEFLVLGFLVCFIFGFMGSVCAIDDGSEFISDISSGVTRVFYAGNVLGFNTLGGRHTFLLMSVREDIVTVKVSDPVQTAALAVGEEKKFDFDGDGIADIYVKINSIANPGKAADVTVQTILEPMSAEPAAIPAVEESAAPSAEEENVQNASDAAEDNAEESSGLGIYYIIVAIVIVAAIAVYFVLRKKK